MVVTNKPFGTDDEPSEEEWTPAIGLRRGLQRGAIVAGVAALLLAPVALYIPYFLIPWLLRCAVALALTYVLMRVVCDAAGMVSRGCIAIAIALGAAVLCSQSLIFAVWGVPALGGMNDWWMFPSVVIEQVFGERVERQIGVTWLHPYILLVLNGVPTAVAGVGCAALFARSD